MYYRAIQRISNSGGEILDQILMNGERFLLSFAYFVLIMGENCITNKLVLRIFYRFNSIRKIKLRNFPKNGIIYK